MKKGILYSTGILLIFLFIIVYLITGWPIVTIYNNFLSSKFLISLENIELPDNSKVIDSYKRFGILYGNGNHCDCEIGVIIESDIEVKEFDNYFRKPIHLDTPFDNDKKRFIYLYYMKKQRLFKIHKGKMLELVYGTEPATNSTDSDGFFHIIELGEYENLRKIVEKIQQKDHKSYFILTASDQSYSGFSFKDIRCH